MTLLWVALTCNGEGPDDSGSPEADADTDSDTDTDLEEDCSEEGDEDGDGLADCEDPDCVDVCLEDCDNGEDDDGDGLVDCDDDECAGEAICLTGYRVSVEVKLDDVTIETGVSSTYGYEAILRGTGAVYLSATPYGEGSAFDCSGMLVVDPGAGSTYGSGLCDGCDWKFALAMSPFWVGGCPVATPLPVSNVGVTSNSGTITRDFDGTWPAQYVAGAQSWDSSGGTLQDLEQQTAWAFLGYY
ncbi:MAG TPA: hypothetical protein QGF58_27100 [Myxococcota bacterium]|nr:hypothetical protein [Myxococcota bacterium]